MKKTRTKHKACSRVRTVCITLLTVATAVGLFGCSPRSMIPGGYAGINVSSRDETVVPSSTKPKEPSASSSSSLPEEPPQVPTYLDFLTGLQTTDSSFENARPISIVIDNKDSALIQCGISASPLWVEAPIESGATRIMLFYSNAKSIPTVASVASTRSYLVKLSNAFGAVSAYAGTTDRIGEASVSFSGFDTLDYILQNLSSVFFRDTAIASPYSLLTDGVRITNGILNCRYSATRKSEQVLPWLFSAEDQLIPSAGERANTVDLCFSVHQSVSFRYDSEIGAYKRMQNGIPHTETQSDAQISFRNLLLLTCDSLVHEQENGTRLDFDLESGGNGYAVFDGVATKIVWRLDESGLLKISDQNGKLLTLPAGKTYVGLLKSSALNAIMLSE
ncbi:MAG: DUF3048 domain-containing protein [Clostridia bacterium]|nr:DUF3048 domain-containing protein [Clostridia bacterium]